MKLKILYSLIFISFLLSCRKDNEDLFDKNDFVNKNVGLSNNDDDEFIKLGNKEPSPYTISNINDACLLLGIPTKSSTHAYIKIIPRNAEEYAELNEREDIELWEFPMDYEIINQGYFYREDGALPGDIQPLYAVIPQNQDLTGYNFSILELLYFPSNEEEILENKAYELIGKDPDTWDNYGFSPKAGGGVNLKDI